ncbi:autotransporter outer membrane beta-barrel domain-containing protein [Legionella lytica]|uniref:Autotransporter outer membrane beta-barrel domain-containing protein n=1 Tax=Legionella lytica TaxID=96232 RepID=A0ABW8D8V3_9GAMM
MIRKSLYWQDAITNPVYIFIGIVSFLGSMPAYTVTCPSPYVVVNSSCEITVGTTVNLTTANGIGMNSSGSLGRILANSVVVNLGAATTTALLAQSGSRIDFQSSRIISTATTSGTSVGQIGVRSMGGSLINVLDSFITMGPANGTTAASNMTGVKAESAGKVFLSKTAVSMLGGTTGANNVGALATGTGSEIDIEGGTISTTARTSYGVLAQSGGIVTLNGTYVATTGVGSATIAGSHALYATGAASQVTGNSVNLNVTGNYANAVRVDAGGSISLQNSTLSSAGTSSADSDPSSTIRVLSAGQADIIGSSITATGQRGSGFSVQDTGSFLRLENSSVSVSGTRAKAGFIFDGASASIIGSSLLSSNTDSLVVQGAGSSAEIIDSTIESTAVLGFGLRATAGAAATMTRGSAITTGRDSPALYAANGSILATNVTVRTSGKDNSIAVLADLAGTINLIGGSVVTTGNAERSSSFPHALTGRNPGGVLTSVGTTVLTTGYIAMGAVADDGGTVVLSGTTIETRGERSIGLFSVTEQVGSEFPANLYGNNIVVSTYGLNAHAADAQARNDVPVEKATIVLNDSYVFTHGVGAVGLRSVLSDYGTRPIQGRGESAVVVNKTIVSTEAIGAHGALSRDQPTSVTMNDSLVLALGQQAHGSVAEAGGRIIGLNSIVQARGTSSSALFLLGTVEAISTGIFTNSKLKNVNGATIGIAGYGNATLTNSFASGSGEWLRVGTAADFFPLASNEPLQYGPPDPDNPDVPPPSFMLSRPAPSLAPLVVPGFANVLLSGSQVIGSAFTASGSISNLTMLNDSLWLMTGNSNVTNLDNNQSLIAYTAPTGNPLLLSTYKTLTTENYIGNNGFILLNTYLGSDPSPSDLLIINGGAEAGSTGLYIRNTTGPGAFTLGNGILVVEAINGASTEPGSFHLAAPVVAGPFEYTLQRSSLDTTSEDNWYLRNLCPPDNPNCSPESPGPRPDPARYRPEIGLYPTLPAMTMLYGQAILDTLHQRVGQGKWPEDPVTPKDVAKRIWGRVVGLHGDRDRINSRRFFRSSDYDYKFGFMQIGGDLIKHKNEKGRRDHAGLYGVVGRGTGDVQRPGRYLGHNEFNGLSLGGYWTIYSPKEAYIDMVLQSTWYSSVKSKSAYIGSLDTRGWGGAASIEAGYPFSYKHNWIAEPQIQAVYQNVNLHSAHDIGTTIIRFTQTDSVAGRLGVRFAHKKVFDEKPKIKTLTTWFRPNIWYQFKGNPNAEFSFAHGFLPFQSQLEGATLELNLGTTLDLPKNVSIYANGSYGVGLNLHATTYDGRVGCKVRV